LEEKAADEKLSQIAKSEVNRQALLGEEGEGRRTVKPQKSSTE
jgi:hypothetical protein